MPGRVGRKSKTDAAPARTRTSARHVEAPDEGPVTTLRTHICQIFAEAQKAVETHRKLLVSLRKIQKECCYEVQDQKQAHRQFADFEAGDFDEEVGRCALRALTIKKGEVVGDRIVKFLAMFLKRANQEDSALAASNGLSEDETPSGRLTTHILSLLLQASTAKDKTVRYRAAQMIPLIVSGLEVLDDELSRRIIANLSKRLRDKETAVRAQSVHGLHIFVRNGAEEEEDDDDSDDETHGTILHKLLDVMQNDPSAEVRRAVLRNIDYSPTTIRYMLERARDEDAITRRILYRVVLPTLADFRALSLVEREKLIRWGLRDRDEQVRKAAARLFRETWIDTCASSNRAPPDAEDKPAEAAPVSMDALLELLERIQVVRSGVEGGIAHEAMREFWDGRPDYIEILTFDDSFLKDLSPESAFVMRSFNDYCLAVDDVRVQTLLDEKMPEVRKLAEIITDRLNDLIEKNSKIAELDTVTQEEEDEFRSLEFVAEQLLHIALTLDYSDEVGRRKIFNVMRGALSLPQLPEGCTSLAVETLRTVCGKRESGEKEFISVVREVIQDVRDTLHDNDNGNETPRSSQAEEDEESFHSAQSDISEDDAIAAKPRKKQAEMTEEDIEKEEDRQAYVFAKCLHIAECMVQNIDCEIEKNDDLIWLLNNLISPACKNHQIVIREAGIKCLGLYSIHSKDLAESNLNIFHFCFNKGHEELQIITIHALCDVILEHPSLLAPPPPTNDPDTTSASVEEATPNKWLKPITEDFLKAFESDQPTLSHIGCIAASKLLLHNILPPTSTAEILKAFVNAYFNPETASNTALQQTLSYCLPAFCHSSRKNALLLAENCIEVIHKLVIDRDALREEYDEDDIDWVSWTVVANHLAEWTDARRVPVRGSDTLGVDASGKVNVLPPSQDPHVSLAIAILERVLSRKCDADEKKPLLTLLSKLNLSPPPAASKDPVKVESRDQDEELLRTMHALAAEAVENKAGPDATTRNFLVKLESALVKRLGEVEQQQSTQVQNAEDGVEAEAEAEADDTTVLPAPTAIKHEEAQQDQEQEGEQEESEIDVEGEEEDTMLAGMQGEGTRMPLFAEEDEDEDEEMQDVDMDDAASDVTVGRTVPRDQRETSVAVSESDIIDSLLESEVGSPSPRHRRVSRRRV